ncbi:LOW QUALITY PROTEIN: hypothetical protein PHMEG_0005961 [Phytophthora megakarya]|uniref:NHL repeat-containing protein n=1 Tax=Phytophthora megakarya TaxID=4795 RepID=A0A225WQ15_9STRA|nr:LOW QUALITY PROTEIN: hypothetical protein PHMEG_0005961 [Phytophthora megakarya]
MARHYEMRWVGSGRRGHLDGDAHDAELNRPFGLCVLRDGTLIFTDTHNNAVRIVISETWRSHVTTVEGSGLLTPKGIAASADERHLFVCDTGHHKIKLAALPHRSVLADIGSIADAVEMFAFAGNGRKGWRDGPALEASFNSPAGVCEHVDGTIVVADTGNHCIRQIRRARNGKLVVRTIAGAYAGTGEKKSGGIQAARKRVAGYRDGIHSLFRSPSAAIAAPNGELLVADTMNNCIRGLLPPCDGNSPWEVRTICGQVRPGHADGNCEVALFDQPVSLCWGVNSDSFFVADRGNACIRQVGRSFGDGLTYSWVCTIEGSYRKPQGQYAAQSCMNAVIPLQNNPNEEAVNPKLVICDGEDNIIKLLPFEELGQQPVDANTNEIPNLSNQRAFSSVTRGFKDSVTSLSSVTNYTDSEGLSEKQFCSCKASRALEEALRTNAALQAENLRLKELLQCTFDEIKLADQRFSENYERQLG